MQIHWEKQNDSYIFNWDHEAIGSMKISYLNLERKAACQINHKGYEIKRTGTWKNKIEICNELNETLMTIAPEKWYSSLWTIEYQNKQFKLKTRNNPLAEYVIFDGDKEIISYGLKSNKDGLSVGIFTNQLGHDYLFDFLLWYLFVPIVSESLGDSFTFFILNQ